MFCLSLRIACPQGKIRGNLQPRSEIFEVQKEIKMAPSTTLSWTRNPWKAGINRAFLFAITHTGRPVVGLVFQVSTRPWKTYPLDSLFFKQSCFGGNTVEFNVRIRTKGKSIFIKLNSTCNTCLDPVESEWCWMILNVLWLRVEFDWPHLFWLVLARILGIVKPRSQGLSSSILGTRLGIVLVSGGFGFKAKGNIKFYWKFNVGSLMSLTTAVSNNFLLWNVWDSGYVLLY